MVKDDNKYTVLWAYWYFLLRFICNYECQPKRKCVKEMMYFSQVFNLFSILSAYIAGVEDFKSFHLEFLLSAQMLFWYLTFEIISQHENPEIFFIPSGLQLGIHFSCHWNIPLSYLLTLFRLYCFCCYFHTNTKVMGIFFGFFVTWGWKSLEDYLWPLSA